MQFQKVLVILAAALIAARAAPIDHDKVKPFEQPEAVTASEKAAVRFQPVLNFRSGCAPYPAVNAAGETSGGLKGTKGSSECEVPPLGSQVYARATWHEDVWAIMYAWYFPKGFWGRRASRRHDWASIVVWIDNPELEKPDVKGLSTSRGDGKYDTIPVQSLLGGVTPSLYHSLGFLGQPYLDVALSRGEHQPLIMWTQLTEEARMALNSTDFGRAKVPINDDNFQGMLEKAWAALDQDS